MTFCDLLQSVVPEGQILLCDRGGLPLLLAVWTVLALAALMLAWLLIGGPARGHPRSQALRRGGAVALTVLAGLLAAMAAQNPRLLRDTPEDQALLVIVQDLSESVLRSPDRALAARRDLATRLSGLAQDADIADTWRGSLVTFGSVAEMPLPDSPLDMLAVALTQPLADRGQAESRVAAGLGAARAAIRAAGGRGAIWLVGDGHWEQDGLEPELRQLQAAGIPLSILPVGSDAPSLGLISADLGPLQSLGAPATLRMVVSGAGQLTLSTASSPPADHAIGAAGQVTPLRQDTHFDRRGLQYATLRYRGDSAPAAQARTLFTLVRGPARVLAYGAAPWAEGLDPALFQVARASADAPEPPEDYDLVILDSLPPSAFPDGYPATLRAAAETGTGLFVVNGPLRGSHEDSQLIADWEETEIGPILPVNSDPQTYLAEPPRRDVVIIVDISGSMEGGRLEIAQQIIERILDNLRPVDTLTILPFREFVDRRFWLRAADARNVTAARTLVRDLHADGGTDQSVAISAASGISSQNCAFFFLSDGDFAAPRTPPTCYTQVFWTTERDPGHPNLGWGADPILRRPGQGVGTLSFPYFEPEPRTTFFREGRFRPTVYADATLDLSLPQVDGLALSYLRQDADLLAFHSSPPPDPVLALWQGGGGAGIRTAAFLSQIPGSWASDPEGREALHNVLNGLLSWTELERYDIRLRDRNGQTEIIVQILAGGAEAAALPDSLDAAILMEDGQSHALFLTPTDAPGRFIARTTLPLGPAPRPALLRLNEAGLRPQLIPMTLPPAPEAAPPLSGEAWVSGTDGERIALIMAATGGQALPAGAALAAGVVQQPRSTALRGLLIALALLAFAGSLWTGAARP